MKFFFSMKSISEFIDAIKIILNHSIKKDNEAVPLPEKWMVKMAIGSQYIQVSFKWAVLSSSCLLFGLRIEFYAPNSPNFCGVETDYFGCLKDNYDYNIFLIFRRATHLLNQSGFI